MRKKMMQRTICLLLLMVLGLSVVVVPVDAQRTATVRGHFTYVVTEHDDITLSQAKRKCVELAKAAAIKGEFGELVTSDVIDTQVETNGESTASYFWENTVAMARGEWLGDIVPPVLNIVYTGDQLVFTAEVYGKAREIIQSRTELKWEVMKDVGDRKRQADVFNSGERIYVNFRSPADGYVAVYLMVGDDETSCLLPYPKDADGRFPVKGGRDYLFFDKAEDPAAYYYRLSTKRQQEDNQLVIIYSPNSFVKCNDKSGDKLHPNSLNTHDFQKWLLKCQRVDRDMVVSKKWIKIRKE